MLVSTETGGLGNRIKSWMSARRLSEDARVYWPLTPNMPARFEELFANAEGIEAVPEQADTYKSWRLATLLEDEVDLPQNFAVVGAGSHPIVRGLDALWCGLRGRRDERYRYMLFPKQHSRRSTRRDARHIDLEYGRIPPAVRQRWVPLFAGIQPQRFIVEQTEHSWRDDPRRFRKYHLPARARLLSMMHARPDADRFLIVSDSDDFVDYLRQQFDPQRLVEWPRQTRREQSWASTEGVCEDLIDMLLLARCRSLLASYLSTFSETAWWLGGAKAEVAVF